MLRRKKMRKVLQVFLNLNLNLNLGILRMRIPFFYQKLSLACQKIVNCKLKKELSSFTHSLTIGNEGKLE
jgi:hypothetical protein